MSSRFRPVIRVFVSSTFSDLKEERNALQRDVFPRLEHYCLVRGFQFQAIDLRWGVSGEAGRDHRTMQICFDELRRAQEVSPRPNFLVLLGDRYGWQPLAETITETEFRELERNAGELDNEVGRDLQAGDSATQTLRTWYCRDDNAVPAEFQLRSRNEWPDGPECSEEEEEQAWRRVEETLWSVINRAFPQETLAGRFGQQIPGPDEPLPSVVKFQASATEQEIWRGALAVPDAPEHVVAWYRTIRNSNQYKHDPKASDFFDSNEVLRGHADELKDELRQRLRREGRPDIQPVDVDLQLSADGVKLEVTRDHLQLMCGEIESRLREIIDEEIRDYWSPAGDSGQAAALGLSGPSEGRKLELETQAHQRFGESRAPRDGFVGRDQELKAIADYLGDENGRNPLVVQGPSGTGKTALLARAAQLAKEGERRIFARFLGTTPQSSNLRNLLQNLCRALRPEHEANKDIPPDLHELQDEFDRLLAQATAGKPILLFLDALDQLDEADGARQTYWLRTPLPPHVKVVASCIRDEEGPAELNESYRSFDRRKLLDRAIAVESLTAPDAIRAIDLWLQHDDRRQRRKRQLTPQHREAIAARITPESATACRRPLYLRILFEECRLWPSWKKVEPAELGGDTAALLKGFFDRLAKPAMHGALLVESVLGYIASARRGLSESEILEVLWADADYRQHLDAVSLKTKHELPPGATRIPIAMWSRLRHDLDPYLAEQSAPGGVVLSFYHRVVGRVVADRFLKNAARRCMRHDRLAKYFQTELQPWWREPHTSEQRAEDTASQRVPNARRATELPWQLLREADSLDPGHEKPVVWDAPANLLCDLKFVEVKCASGLIFELQDDYRNTIAALPEAQEHLRLERERQARLARWAEEITAYSCEWSNRRDRVARGELVSEPEPVMPVPPPASRIKSDDEMLAEYGRLLQNPTRLDALKRFSGFVAEQQYALSLFGEIPGFAIQQAYNWDSKGVVHDRAVEACEGMRYPVLLRQWTEDHLPNPNGTQVKVLAGHSDWVLDVGITIDGKRAVSASQDGTLRVWNLDNGRCLNILEGHQGVVRCVSLTVDGLKAISGGDDGSLRVWCLETGRCLQVLNCGGSVADVSITPDGRLAISAAQDQRLRLWDIAIGTQLSQLKLDEECESVRITPDGRLAIAGELNRISIWDLTTGLQQRMLGGNEGPECIALTFDATRVLAGSSEGKLKTWEIGTGECIGTLGDELFFREGRAQNFIDIRSIAISGDGTRAVLGSQNRTVRVMDLLSGKCLMTLRGHSYMVLAVDMTPDGARAVSGGADNTVRVWDTTNGSCPWADIPYHTESINSVSITADGRRAVTAGADRIVQVWNGNKAEQLWEIKGHRGDITGVSVTRDNLHAVSVSIDDTIRVWDLTSGDCISVGQMHEKTGHLSCVAVTDRRTVTVCGHGRLVYVFNAENIGRPFRGHFDEVNAVSVTADGQRLISGSSDKTVRIWDIETGQCLSILLGHEGPVKGVDITADGNWAISGSEDKTIRIWNLNAGVCTHTLKGHTATVNCVSLTPNGWRAVSASDDKSDRVWDMLSGACIALFYADTRIRCASASSERIVSGTEDGSVLFLQMRGFKHWVRNSVF